jgi:hypothetical protein
MPGWYVSRSTWLTTTSGGLGANAVTQAIGVIVVRPESPPDADSPDRVPIRGSTGIMVALDDPPAGQVAISWSEDGCPYQIWIGPGHAVEEVRRFAAIY